MVKRKLASLLLFLVCFSGKVCCQRTGTGPRDRGNPDYRRGGGHPGAGTTNTEVDLVPRTGTGAKDRMGVVDDRVSQGELVEGQNEGNTASSNLAVNLTHALAVDQGIAEGGCEEACLGILR